MGRVFSRLVMAISTEGDVNIGMRSPGAGGAARLERGELGRYRLSQLLGDSGTDIGTRRI